MMTWTAILHNPKMGELERRTMLGPHGSDAMQKEVEETIHSEGLEIVALVKGNHEVYFGSDSQRDQ